MANPELIRKALLALLGAKRTNNATSAELAATGVNRDHPALPSSPERLRDARQDARQVQGSDPLVTSNAEFQGSPEAGTFPDQPVKRGGLVQDPSRLPDSTSGRASDFEQDLVTSYKELTGQNPPPGMSYNEMEHIIESILGPNRSADLDVIPF